VREEADELARALVGEDAGRVVEEAADVVYHILVGLLARGVTVRDVEAELARRFGTSGLVEKAARKH
jgi:phosphoribosyl-ATP pyrophosphohydrolase